MGSPQSSGLSGLARTRQRIARTAGIHDYGLGVLVGVIDTGLNWRAHPTEFYVDNIIDEHLCEEDATGHGTAVCSLLIGRQLGWAPQANLRSWAVMGPSGKISSHSIYTALSEALDLGCQVVNISLGSRQPSKQLQDLCLSAYERGVIIIAASGNRSGEMCLPAGYERVIGVGAVNANGQLLGDSGYDAVLPRVELVELGERILVAGKTSVLEYQSGTSFATASVTGQIVLALAAAKKAGGSFSAGQLQAALPKLCVGDVAGKQLKTGYGRLDLWKLLSWAKGCGDATLTANRRVL